MPLGSLLGGAATAVLGARLAFAMAGVILIAAGLAALLVRRQITQVRIGPDGQIRQLSREAATRLAD